MVDYTNFDLYTEETVDKQLVISFDGGTITNEDLHQEEFELTESLCSDSQLTFGSCEASEVKFRISNVFTSLKDKWLTITQILNGDTENPLQIGKYKVYSDKPTADRSYRDIAAYDVMYDIINADVVAWYNGLTFPMTLKAFRDSFFEFFGIEQQEISLVNDDMEIEKTIEPSVLSGKDVLQSICQINGCFGHIGRDGKMQYVFLKRSIDGGLFPDTELYPSDKLFPVKESIRNNLYPYNNLYPSDDLIPVKSISSDSTYPQIITTIPKSAYIHCYYEDYIVKKIDKLIIRQEENDVGCTVGNGDNAYIIEDNFLVYGKSQEELTEIATNTLAVIEDIEYRPITDSEVLGNPCLEVGDAIRFYTRYEIVDSYILNRTLKGIQGLIDSYVSDGEEYQSEKVNDIQTDIKQLKGKSNTLERTIEETRSTIANVEEGLQSQITQTAGQIVLSVNSKGKIVQVELSADPDSGSVFSVSADNIELSTEEVISLMAGGNLDLSGKNITITSDNFSVNEDGDTSLKGDVDAKSLAVNTSISVYSGTFLRNTNVIETYKDSSSVSTVPILRLGNNGFSETEIAGLTVSIPNNLTVTGIKSRLAPTENYNDRLLYCYEMPSPFFGDIGHGIIGEDGLCYIDIDSVFAETIDTVQEYYVFLTPYRTDKAMFIQEKEHGYFIVQGEPGTEFDWEIKAKQSDFPMERLEENTVQDTDNIDYEQEAINYLNEYEKELTNYGY